MNGINNGNNENQIPSISLKDVFKKIFDRFIQTRTYRFPARINDLPSERARFDAERVTTSLSDDWGLTDIELKRARAGVPITRQELSIPLEHVKAMDTSSLTPNFEHPSKYVTAGSSPTYNEMQMANFPNGIFRSDKLVSFIERAGGEDQLSTKMRELGQRISQRRKILDRYRGPLENPDPTYISDPSRIPQADPDLEMVDTMSRSIAMEGNAIPVIIECDAEERKKIIYSNAVPIGSTAMSFYGMYNDKYLFTSVSLDGEPFDLGNIDKYPIMKSSEEMKGLTINKVVKMSLSNGVTKQ